MKLNQIWNVIPSQLAKENKKFIYSVIRKGACTQEFELAIQWLAEAGLTHGKLCGTRIGASGT